MLDQPKCFAQQSFLAGSLHCIAVFSRNADSQPGLLEVVSDGKQEQALIAGSLFGGIHVSEVLLPPDAIRIGKTKLFHCTPPESLGPGKASYS